MDGQRWCSDHPMYKHEQQLQTSIASAAVLSYLGWLGSGSASAPVQAPMGKGKRLKGKSGGGSNGPTGMSPQARADLRVRPPNNANVPHSVPRSVPNQVVWDVVKIDGVVANSTTGLTETNFSFNLSQHPQASSWAALFDQWCIPQASVSFLSMVPPGSTTIPPRLYTALDFDNANALGSISSIEDYSTAQVVELQPQVRLVRSIKPCVKPVLLGSLAGVERMWCDSGTNNVGWYGIRSIMSTSTAILQMSTTVTIWFAFRNQI